MTGVAFQLFLDGGEVSLPNKGLVNEHHSTGRSYDYRIFYKKFLRKRATRKMSKSQR